MYNPINIISLLDNREMTDYIDALKLISFLIDYHNLMSYKNWQLCNILFDYTLTPIPVIVVWIINRNQISDTGIFINKIISSKTCNLRAVYEKNEDKVYICAGRWNPRVWYIWLCPRKQFSIMILFNSSIYFRISI